MAGHPSAPAPATLTVLEEVPAQLIEDVGSKRRPANSYASSSYAAGGYSRPGSSGIRHDDHTSTHYSYEDEDQSASWGAKARAAI